MSPRKEEDLYEAAMNALILVCLTLGAFLGIALARLAEWGHAP